MSALCRSPRRASLAAAALALAGCSGEGPTLPPSDVAWPGADVTILRDEHGFAHVYADADDDALFGSGYAMARDRVVQMELYRRQARGTQAELLGEGAYRDDFASRLVGFARLGAADAAHALAEHPGDARLVAAWCAGVNRFLADVRAGAAPRPAGLRPGELAADGFVPEDWTPADAYAVGKLLAFGLSDSLDATLLSTVILALAPDAAERLQLLRPAVPALPAGAFSNGEPGGSAYWLPPPGGAPAKPTYPADLLEGLPPPRFRGLERRLGSNNWGVTGARSATGRPIVCGDPHQGHTAPSRLYPVHLSSLRGGGDLDVIGFAFPGTPAVQLGHNQRVAWTGTINFADAMDVFDVPAGADSLTVAGEQVDIQKRTEVIRVRGPADPAFSGEEREVTFEDVPGWGVLLPDDLLPVPSIFLAQGRLLFAWTGFRGPTIEATAYLGLDRSLDVEGFELAAQDLQVGAINFLAADKDHLLYTVHADIPDRGDPAAREMPFKVVSGADAGALWKGPLLPHEKFPRSLDPARGYLVTANQDPLGFTADGDVTNDPYYYGGLFDPGFRAGRASSALAALTQAGVVFRSDLEALQDDVHSTMADLLIPLVLDAIAAVGTDPALVEFEGREDLVVLASRLGFWDRRFSRDASAPWLFTGLEFFAARRAFEGPLTSTLYGAVAGASPPYVLGALAKLVTGAVDDPAYFAPDGIAPLLLRALADTSDWALATYGSFDAVPLHGDVSFAHFSSPLGPAWEPPLVSVEGSSDTLNVAESRFFDDAGAPRGQLVTGSGAVYRMCVEFNDGGVTSTLAFAGGVAEDPASPWFENRLGGWLAGQHEPIWFAEGDVLAHEVERVVVPAAR